MLQTIEGMGGLVRRLNQLADELGPQGLSIVQLLPYDRDGHVADGKTLVRWDAETHDRSGAGHRKQHRRLRRAAGRGDGRAGQRSLSHPPPLQAVPRSVETPDGSASDMLARVERTANNVFVVTPPPGKWAADDAAQAIAAMERQMDPADVYVFVGDASAITDYEPEARRLFQAFLKQRRKQFRSLWIVGPKIHPVVRMAITMVATFARLEFHFVTRRAHIPELAEDAPAAPG